MRGRLEQRERSDRLTAEQLMNLARFTVDSEIRRYESLSALATRMLTCISILSIALITLLGPLAPIMGDGDFGRFILISYTVTFLILAAAFILALVSQWRYKYTLLNSPEQLANEMPDLLTESMAAIYYCDSLQKTYASLKRRNDVIVKLLTATTVLLLVDIGVISVWALIAVKLYAFS